MASHYVHIIESPSAQDLFDGRTEGDILRRSLNLAGVDAWYRLVTSRALFERALGGQDLLAAHEKFEGAMPVFHISAHGNEDGFGFTNGDFVAWHEFAKMISPLNTALSGNLILGMSCCQGAAAIRMAMTEAGEELPFNLLASHYGKPSWGDAAVGFVALYHRLFKESTLPDAISAMRAASGDEGFVLEVGSQVQARWNEYREQRYQEALANALNPGTSEPPGSDTNTNGPTESV